MSTDAKALVERLRKFRKALLKSECLDQETSALIDELDDALSLREKREGWISVSERLPESDTPVCVWVPNYYRYKGGHDQAMLRNGLWTNMRYRQPLGVTHWMPLPAAPGARGEEGK